MSGHISHPGRDMLYTCLGPLSIWDKWAHPPLCTAFPSGSPALVPRATDLPDRSTILLSEHHLVDYGTNCFHWDLTASHLDTVIWLECIPSPFLQTACLRQFLFLFSFNPENSRSTIHYFTNQLQIYFSEHPFSSPIFWVSNAELTCKSSGTNFSLSEGGHHIRKFGCVFPWLSKGVISGLTYLPNSRFNYHEDSTLKLTCRKVLYSGTSRCLREFPAESFDPSRWKEELI